MARPANNHGHANTAIVQVALVARERPAALEKHGIMTAFLVRAVVAAEEDERVSIEPQFLESRHQPADVSIHTRDHSRKVLLNLRPWLSGVRRIARHLHAVSFGAA